MKFLLLYLLGLLVFGLRDLFHKRSYDDFVVAGRKQGLWPVLMSLMATMIGASATIGIAARAETIGFPAFWWLGCGAFGLVAQGFLLSKKIRGSGCRTLPELAQAKIGTGGRRLVAGVIVLSWLGIIAAQFAAAASLLQLAVGWQNGVSAIVATAALVILYTWVGGQLSVVRTDMFQFTILIVGFVGLFIYMVLHPGDPSVIAKYPICLFSQDFSWVDFIPLFFTVGGAYFLGPDITSRNFLAKDVKTAQHSVFWAAPFLLIFSFLITWIGMRAGALVPGEGNPLFRLMSVIPLPLAALVSIGLICALISSADTCLVNTAVIVEQDIFQFHTIRKLRWTIVCVGIISTALALWGKDIIQLLLMAYSIYTPGIVCPLMIAILCPKTMEIRRPIWFLAVIVGGSLGVLQGILLMLGLDSLSWVSYLSPVGMALSLILAWFSLEKGEAGC